MFSKNALRVLEKRYLVRDEDGNLMENPEQLVARVAHAVAQAETHWMQDADKVAAIEQQFQSAMLKRQFMPNSPTLMNAGKPNGQLSACFVLPVPDSLEGIFETCKHAALIHQTGGGTGFSFSRLRPAFDRVATTTGVASGPVSFMTVYDAATEAIRQGGTRRGANMGILHISHPDIEEFVACKQDTSKLNNFNISVTVTDQFMQAVEGNADFDLINPRNKKVVRRVNASKLFEKIVTNAHTTGEPGVIFIDRINAADPLIQTKSDDGQVIAGTEDIEATNPCGEQPLGPGDACNLGSINLAEFVDESKADMHWSSLGEMVDLAVRFLDDIVEANHYPLPFIAKAALGNRRIGLGVMGWAEALIKMGLAYDSQQAIEKAEQVMSFINDRAHAASVHLAGERGTFPNWLCSTWYQADIKMRNATVTTIAPTGTISIIAGTSSGIEPLFAVSYVRRVMGGEELVEVNPLFEKIARQRGFYSEDLMREIAYHGSVREIEAVPADVKRLFVCSHEIPFAWHVRMQAAFQKYTDCAVSKTINLPQEATVDDVRQAYLTAYKLGLKGITVYRDTSRHSQVLNIGRTDPRKKSDFANRAGTFSSPRESSSRTQQHIQSRRKQGEGSQLIAMPQQVVRLYSRQRNSFSCPDCGNGLGSLAFLEACRICHTCGYTKC